MNCLRHVLCYHDLRFVKKIIKTSKSIDILKGVVKIEDTYKTTSPNLSLSKVSF